MPLITSKTTEILSLFPLDAFKWSLRQFSSVSRVSVWVWHESVQLFCSYIWRMFFFLTNYWVSPRHVTFISVSRRFFSGGCFMAFFFRPKLFIFFYTGRGLICDINFLFRELSSLFMAKAFSVICCPVRENKRLRLKLLFFYWFFDAMTTKKMASKRQNVSEQKFCFLWAKLCWLLERKSFWRFIFCVITAMLLVSKLVINISGHVLSQL